MSATRGASYVRGGGAGGLSVAVGYLGNAPILDATTVTSPKTGTTALGGSGVSTAAAGGTNPIGTGLSGGTSTSGKDGVAQAVLNLQ